jgi:glycosyltransferase involved in cell wall biosynthesis
VSRTPRVSVCVPTWNGARWVEESVRSALAQTVDDLEVVVVDDASSDATPRLVEAIGDPRVRVERNPRRLGLVGNWNRAIALSRAPFVKLLFQDDVLYPRCVERLIEAIGRDDAVGLAFGRRDVVLDADAGERERETALWIADVHRMVGEPAPLMAARDLFARWLGMKARYNVVGEPPCTLLRRAALERIGLFNGRVAQLVDMEMWGRLAFFGAVAFVDEPVCTFRVHRRSTTGSNVSAGKDWLDRLWLLEGLLAHREIAAAHPVLRRWRDQNARRVAKKAFSAAMGLRARPNARALRGLRDWAVWRLRGAAGRRPSLHPTLRAVAAP